MPKVTLYYYDKFHRRINYTVDDKQLEAAKIDLLEQAKLNDWGDLYVEQDGVTKVLCYYND